MTDPKAINEETNEELSSIDLKGVSGGSGQRDREFQRMNAQQKKHAKHVVEGLSKEEAIAGKRNREGLLNTTRKS